MEEGHPDRARAGVGTTTGWQPHNEGEPVAQLKVSAKSNPNAVAGAFAGVVREHGTAEVHVIGAGALNQAMKAVAIARTFLEEQGIDLVCIPSFVTLDVDGQERTAIRLVVEDRENAPAVIDLTEADDPAADAPLTVEDVDATPR
jgi:stage V sporulation protein S